VIKKENFRVLEDNVEQQITHFSPVDQRHDDIGDNKRNLSAHLAVDVLHPCLVAFQEFQAIHHPLIHLLGMLMTGQVKPTEGYAYTAGFNVLTQHKELVQRIGYVPQLEHLSLYFNCNASRIACFLGKPTA
jgi:hypothetical protein